MIREAIIALVEGRSLTMEEATQVMEEIMTGESTPAQFGAFVTALRLKGETADEIAGMARVMREKALRVDVQGPLVDTCGTGGDASHTFNISTAAAFVVAGAGLKVAKHGNRAMSGACGSADVLEALGVKIDLGPQGVARCLEEVGIGFMFAPIFHPAMKYAAGPRREVGIRTVFNVLGPLTNPAGAQAQVLGVADPTLGEKLARVLGRLGSRHALVVHGAQGIDEVVACGESTVWELKGGEVASYTIAPEDAGISRSPIEAIRGGTVEANVALFQQALSGQPGPARDVVLLNAAAALVAADKASTLKEGVNLVALAIDSDAAREKLDQLVKLSQRLT